MGETALNSWNRAWNRQFPPDGILLGGRPVDASIVSGMNAIVKNTIVGNVVNFGSYSDTATRIALCKRSTAKVYISNSSGTPMTAAWTPGIVCATPTERTVSAISGKVQYVTLSADGSDKDRIVRVAQ